MDRAYHILTIYTRLLQQKEVNKNALTIELNSSPRTIQRDIDDIRNYLYETEDWQGKRQDVNYDYKQESYTLRENKHSY